MDNQSIDNQSEDNQNLSLREHVYQSLGSYFAVLEGQMPNDLYDMVIGEIEQPMIQFVMEHTENNQTHCAQILGISRNTLRKKLKQHNLENLNDP
jgi:Fis family transcriptional regulator, factor for inversion stimulation protein